MINQPQNNTTFLTTESAHLLLHSHSTLSHSNLMVRDWVYATQDWIFESRWMFGKFLCNQMYYRNRQTPYTFRSDWLLSKRQAVFFIWLTPLKYSLDTFGSQDSTVHMIKSHEAKKKMTKFILSRFARRAIKFQKTQWSHNKTKGSSQRKRVTEKV